MKKTLLTACVASCLVLPISLAWGQGKPSLAPEAVPVELGPDVGKWRDSYAKAGRPRVMVLVAEAASSVSPVDMESLVKLADEDGVSAKISSAFQEVIGDPQADCELIDRAALVNAVKRFAGNRAQAGDQDSIAMLGRELGADLAIVIKLLPTQRDGADFSVTFDTRDLARGRRGMSFPFDWKGGTSVPNIKNNSRAMARKFIDDFAERSVMPRRFTLRILGLSQTSDQTQAYKAIRESREWAKGVISRGSDTVPDLRNPRLNVASSQYEITLTDTADTDPIIVQDGIETALKRVFPDRELQTLQTDRGSVSVQLFPKKTAAVAAETPDDCVLVLLDDESGKAARKELKQLYENRNSPRVAILVNRPLTPKERKALEAKGGMGNVDNLIVIGGRDATGIDQGGNKTAVPTDEDFLNPSVLEQNAREMERAISELFNQKLGLTRIISADVARANAAAEAAKQNNVMAQTELVEIMKRQDLADVVIIGTGRIDGYEQRYSFEAINLRDAIKIGFGDTRYSPFGGERDPVAILSRLKEKAGAGSESAADAAAREATQIAIDEIKKMANEATSKLACSMMSNWRPPSEMDLIVNNLSSQTELDQLIAELKKDTSKIEMIGSTSYEGGQGNGTGRFRIRYRSHADSVPAEVRRLTEGLPFRVNFQSKTDTSSVLSIERK